MEMMTECAIVRSEMQVKGLRDALGEKGVSSNYSYEYADKTWVQPGLLHEFAKHQTSPPLSLLADSTTSSISPRGRRSSPIQPLPSSVAVHPKRSVSCWEPRVSTARSGDLVLA